MKKSPHTKRQKRSLTFLAAAAVFAIVFILVGAFWLSPSSFKKLALPTVFGDLDDPVILVAGDIASCSHDRDEATAKILDATNGTVLTLGDNVYTNGTSAEFTNCYDPTWGRHKARTKPVPGNHDYNTPNATGYYGYFGAIASPDEPTCTGGCKGYYSYNLGDWHIVALNSEIAHNATSAQVAWLQADLAANQSQCTLAYWHKPRFSSGQHGGSTSRAALWNVLYQYKADIVLNGHEHLYERFGPQNPSGVADPEGIRQFTVGTGGASLYSFPTVQPNSEVRENTSWGVMKLTLHATSYDWEFMPIAGQTFSDSGSANCVGLTGPTPTIDPNATPTPTSIPTATVSRQVSQSSDDAEQNLATGSTNIISSDLEFVTDNTTQQTIAMRFTDVAVPQGAVITDSYIEFTADEQQPDATSLTFYGQAADNPLTFSTTNGNISTRPKTGNATSWNNIPSWITNVKYRTPSLNPVINEIVHRSGWTSGNAMAFIVTGTGHRTADAFDGGATVSPKLVISYATDPNAPTPSSTPSPGLTVTPTELPTPTPSPIPAQLLTIPVTEDAFVRSTYPTRNYGLTNRFEVDNSPVKHALLKFNVTGVGARAITSAKLVIYNIDKSPKGGDFYKAIHNNWSESTVTWNTAPASNGALITSMNTVNGTTGNPKPYEVNLTGSVTGDGEVTFRVITTNIDGADYISKQGAADKVPKLILTITE